MSGLFECEVRLFGQVAVDGGMCGVVVVKSDVEGRKVAFMAGLGGGDKGFRRHARFFCGQHDRGAVGVVGANKPGVVSSQAPCAYPDVSLNVADQMAEVQWTIGVRQGGGDKCCGHEGEWYQGVRVSHVR